jgi:uncharacterized protein
VAPAERGGCATCQVCYAAQAGGGRVVSATVYPTERCNLSCGYCFYFNYKRQFARRDMDEGTATAAMDFLAKRAEREGANAIHVAWFGAEPTLRMPFIEWFMETARRRHPKYKWSTSITTNGVLLASERFAERFRIFTRVILSVDGVGEWHDMYRRFPDGRGSWEYVERAIRNLLRLGVPFTVRMTLAPENVAGAYEGVKALVEMGVRDIFTGVVEEDVWDEESLWELRRQYQLIADYLIGRLLEGVPVRWGQFAQGADLVFRDEPRGEHEHCGQLGGSTGIYVDGSIYTCHRAVGIPQLRVGDVFSGVPPEVEGRYARMWSRSRALRESGLEGYPFAERSFLGCLVANYEARGDIHRANAPLLKAYEESCALAALKLFMAGRARQSRLVYDMYFKGIVG